jgi:Tfp pilus assembly protein PilF
LKLQTWTPAFQSAVRAANTAEDRQNAFYNLAIFFATQNDAANVERALRNSIQWAPNWFKPHWTLSKLFLTQNRLADAELEARIAVNLNGGKDPEVAQTLDAIRSRSMDRR